MMKLMMSHWLGRIATITGVLAVTLQLTGCPAVFVAGAAGAAGGYYAGQESDRSMGQVFDDASITTAVNARFVKDKRVRARDIDVDTLKGVVTLTGKVESRKARDQAIRLTKGVVGVKKVIVKLKIVP